jgi:hypothetical protein
MPPPFPPPPPEPPDSPDRFSLTDTDASDSDATETDLTKPLNVVWPKYLTGDGVTYFDAQICGTGFPNGDMGVASVTNPMVMAGLTNAHFLGVNLAYHCDVVTPYVDRFHAELNLGHQTCDGDQVIVSFVPNSIPAGVDNEDLVVYLFFNKPTSAYHYISSTKDTAHMIKAFSNLQMPGTPDWSNSPTFTFTLSSHHFQELPWANNNAAYAEVSPRNVGKGIFAQLYTSCGTAEPPNATLGILGSSLGNCGGKLKMKYVRNVFSAAQSGSSVPMCAVTYPPPSPPLPARPPPPASVPPEPPQAPAAPRPPPNPAAAGLGFRV